MIQVFKKTRQVKIFRFSFYSNVSKLFLH